jgi:GT2 family glycosyltransferase
VIVIDDGSTDEASLRVFDQMAALYPNYRFVRQANAGIGATRNRGLAEGRGHFYLPVDADNVLRPDMVSTLVRAMHLRPEAAALTCYFLAFENSADIAAGRFLYSCRPTGGPFALSCHLNVYGDACALFRADAFRSVGGFEEDRGTSFEDWEAFVKLAGRGFVVDVVPDHLFYYRHLSSGFSRVTDQLANRRRVLRRFRDADGLPAEERELVYEALAGMSMATEQAREREGRWPYRLARQAWHLARWLTGGGFSQPPNHLPTQE